MRNTLAFIALMTMLLIIAGSKGTPTGLYARKESPKKATASILRTFRVSAYCGNFCCCQGYADGITASGHKISLGDKLIAAPRDISFGTMIKVPGYGVASVEDRGGAITGNRLDLYFDTHQEALEWGVQYLECEIIK